MNTTATPPPAPKRWRVGLLICWFLVGLVVLLVLAAALFYPVENWRGKRAWEKCKRELEAKGEVLDWAAYIPPPVADEQNIFKAHNMAEWFVGRGTNELLKRLDPEKLFDFSRRFYTNVVADVTVVSPKEIIAPGKADIVLRYDPPVLTSAADDLSHPRSVIIPLVIFENVSLRTAIENLARQANLRYVLDPKLGFDSSDRPQPEISRRWKNVTAQQVLFTLLNDYGLQWIDDSKTGVARISRKHPGSPNLVYVDPAAREQIRELIQNTIESTTNDFHGPSATGVQGFAFVVKPSSRVMQRARVFVHAGKVPSVKEVAEFFPANVVVTNSQEVGLRVRPAGGRFHLLLSPPPYTAAEYLAWSDQFEADFDAIREALKRPHARMEGDYQRPFEIPIQNFVFMRSIVQTLAQRTQCYLLLNQPEKALRELTLIHDLCRLLEGKPTGKPMTLVAVMIDVAITGLYADIVADGLRWHAWLEPQLVAIQEQLKHINLSGLVAEGIRSDRAASIRTLETILTSKRASSSSDTKTQVWQLPGFPRGWLYQNLVNIALMEQKAVDSLDLTNNVILTRRANMFSEEMDKDYARFRPYTYIAAIAVPNYTLALRTLALNQTQVNEALIACALERYRIANGQYPGTLDALTSQFIEQLPHDIVNGHPLKYRRNSEGQFLLYSVGWNVTDDDGITRFKKDGSLEKAQGDWVWPRPSK